MTDPSDLANWSQEQSRADMEPSREPFRDVLTDLSLTIQNVGDAALWGAVGQVVLFQSMLLQKEAQHLLRLSLRNGGVLFFISRHLVG